MNKIKILTHCKNCGAPATSDICQYCKSSTGLQDKLGLEYPIIECKEVNINSDTVEYYFLTAFSIGLMITALSICMILTNGLPLLIIIIPLSILLIYNINKGMKPLKMNRLVKKYGKDIEGIVKGYITSDSNLFEGTNYIVKLLLDTNDGKKYILYELSKPKVKYKNDVKLKLRVYKDMFNLIEHNARFKDVIKMLFNNRK